MKNLPVHWYEGLFLRPHHLQATDRHWGELLRSSLQWDNPYNYGLFAFEFSPEALANQFLDVRVLKARMPDGTLIDFDVGRQPDRVELKGALDEVSNLIVRLGDAFKQVSNVRVYLAVPKLKMGHENVSAGNKNGEIRYSETRRTIADENRGGFDQEVQFRELNAKLMLSTQDLSGYDLLPIAQIKRAGEGEAAPELDEEYIPPVATVDAWTVLREKIVRAIYDIIGRKIEVLSQQVINRGIMREGLAPGDQDRISMLEKLNEAFATLSIMAFARGIPPLTVYTELCRILGQLSIFTRERRTTDIPPYNHEDLARIFYEVKRRIVAILDKMKEYQYEQRFFLGAGLGMQVTLQPRWFNSDWDWCIGVRQGDLSPQECRNLLAQANWKFGSSRQVENIFLRRAAGIHLKPLDRPVRALPTGKDWIFYEVAQDDSPAWQDVVVTQTLAMRLTDNIVVNKDRLQGERKLVVDVVGRRVSLEFALFAMPHNQ